MKKVLIGTVGYHNLRNHSVGPALLPQLQQLPWTRKVDVEEMNWGPIAIVQRFQTLRVPYDRVILLSAIERPGRQVGEITVYRWAGGLPDPEMIQRCIGDAVTGVISVEGLLVVGEYFQIWSGETFLVDVEPGPEEAGEGFSEELEQAIPEVLLTLQELALADPVEMITFKLLYGDTLIEA